METKEFIAHLKTLNLYLSVEGDKLILKGNKQKLTKQELESIRENKEVINYIKEHKSSLIAYISKEEDTAYTPANVAAIYRLSALQQGMLFHTLYDNNTSAYIEQLKCDLIDLQVDALIESWKYLVNHHSILRTSFHHDEFSILVQCVHDTVELPIRIVDYAHMSNEESERAIEDYEFKDRQLGFDLKSAPLMRITLMQLSQHRYKMLWSWHHILLDGWSMAVLIQELLSNYETLISGNALTIGKEDRYQEYIKYIEARDKEQEEIYWRNYLKGVEESTLLPFIASGAERNKGIGLHKQEQLQLNSITTTAIETYAQQHQLTINTVMQGVWSYLLYRYTGKTTVTYGVTVSGRPEHMVNIESRVGLYINTLPLRSVIQQEQSIGSWLQAVQQDQIESREYQYTSLSNIQNWVGVKGDLFDTLLVFENYPVSKLGASHNSPLQVENVQVTEQTNYPLTIIIAASKEVSINFDYNADLLDYKHVQQIKAHFEHVLLQIIQNKSQKVQDIDLLTLADYKVIDEWNHTATTYSSDKTIIDLFEEQVARTPDHVAVVFEDTQLSYSELNRLSNQLGAYLRTTYQIQPDDLIGIRLDRSEWMMVSILGILKSGGAYVPIDPSYPQDRIDYIVEDSGCKVLIDPEELAQFINDKDKHSSTNQKTSVQPHHLVYCIYTSGTTGKPKGALIEHTSLVNKLQWMQKAYPLSEKDRVLQKTTYSFDVSVWELLWWSIQGASVCMLPAGEEKDPARIIAAIQRYNITVTHFVPSMLAVFMDYLEGQQDSSGIAGLKQVFASGEALTVHQTERFVALLPGISLMNLYGPTEATIEVSYFDCSKGPLNGIIPIGKPIDNTSLLILDADQHVVPVGVAGELHIGGVGLARGYLNRPELTAEKFITHPYKPGERLYKTGDLSRWLPDGNIEYLGRKDDQVKIRGYRIELGEIGNVLQKCDQVKQNVVVAKADAAGNSRLVAYIVSEGTFDKSYIQSYLRSQLPDYMIPSLILEIDNIPLNANGKVDKKALPDPDTSVLTNHEYVAPGNEVEEKLVLIWKEILQVERVGIHDDFFELGGHSLLVTRVVSAVRKQFSVELAIKDLFTKSTIAVLAEYMLTEAQASTLPSITLQERPERIPLSFSQERLWFIDKLEGSVHYHIPAVLRLQGNVDKDALAYAFREIVNRHEVLRTVIVEEDGQGYQQVQDRDTWELSYTAEIAADSLEELIAEETGRPFDLSKDMMLRVHLVKLSEEEHLLTIVMHHIAADGWSQFIFIKELEALYNAKKKDQLANIPAIPIQYADYALWQRSYLTGDTLSKRLDYWEQKLAGVELLNLPADYHRPSTLSNRGKVLKFKLVKELRAELLTLAKQEGVTMYMLLLAVFKVLLYRYSGQSDVCVGSPIANRTQKEVEPLIGFFVNTLALRSQLDSEMSFKELLSQVKKTTLEAYQYQELPFEYILNRINQGRELNRSPLFQVMFISNKQNIQQVELENLTLAADDFDYKVAKFDLTANVVETDEGLYMGIEYSTDLFTGQTIERMKEHYEWLLSAVVKNPLEKISKLNLLSPSAQEQLLHEFNNKALAYHQDKTIVDLFEEQVAHTPDNIAVMFEDKELSYAALNKLSNQLGDYLRNTYAIKPDDLVGIALDRSEWMIVAILGVLKSGGAYVPIDPFYPQERIDFIVEDSACKTVIDEQELERFISNKDKYNSENQRSTKEPHHLAYCIYTSGTTGNPKGVLIEDISLVDYALSFKQFFNLTPKDVLIQQSSISFDTFVEEFYGAILSGSKVIVTVNGGRDISELTKIISEKGATLIGSTPSVINELNQELADIGALRAVISGGDVLRYSDINNLVNKVAVFNTYGPTEATVCSTYYKLNKLDETILIGAPIDNRSIYILDSNQGLLPISVPGELCIGGVGLARGYLNQPELTAAKFIENPYKKGERIYRTGDLARWLPDGNIEYLGRIDDQVKIRGYRIELGEIEIVLQQCPLVRQCAVLAKEDAKGNKRLVAYIVAEGNYDKDGIQTYLKAQLPNYMVPAVMMELAALPLNANGKIDKKALPNPDVSALLNNEYAAPRNETEEQLAEIWKKLLQIERVGIYDNFFELGGDSMLTVKVVAEINRSFNIQLKVNSLFICPTIDEFTKLMSDPAKYGALKSVKIDIEKESCLEVSFDKIDTLPKYRENPGNVLITGATGFVGVYLLKELLDHTRATIYCLVRGNNPSGLKDRIIDQLRYYHLYSPSYQDRIVPVCGDLSKPYLGVVEETYQDLASHIDYIYHVAAYMDLQSSYQQLKPHNVDSNIEVIKLSIAEKLKKVIYISTLSVFSNPAKKIRYENDSIDNEIHMYSSGYAGSKWVGEKVMLKAIEKGLPIQIHRLGLITGDNVTGKMPDKQWFPILLKVCNELGAYCQGYKAAVTPVDFVAKSILNLSRKEGLETNVFHLANPRNVAISKFFENVDGLTREISSVTLQEWLIRLKKLSESSLLPIHGLIDLTSKEVKDEIEGRTQTEFSLPEDSPISSQITLSILKEAGITFPEEEQYCTKYLNGILEG